MAARNKKGKIYEKDIVDVGMRDRRVRVHGGFFSLNFRKNEGSSVVDRPEAILNNEKQNAQNDIRKLQEELKAKPDAEKKKSLNAAERSKNAETKVLKQKKKAIEKADKTQKKLLRF